MTKIKLFTIAILLLLQVRLLSQPKTLYIYRNGFQIFTKSTDDIDSITFIDREYIPEVTTPECKTGELSKLGDLPLVPYQRPVNRFNYSNLMYANDFFIYYVAIGGNFDFRIIEFNIASGDFSTIFQNNILPRGLAGNKNFFYYNYEESSASSVKRIEQFQVGVPRSSYGIVPSSGILAGTYEAGAISVVSNEVQLVPNQPGSISVVSNKNPRNLTNVGNGYIANDMREIHEVKNILTAPQTETILGQLNNTDGSGCNGPICFYDKITGDQDYIYFERYEASINPAEELRTLVRYNRNTSVFTTIEDVPPLVNRYIRLLTTTNGIIYNERMPNGDVAIKYITHNSTTPRLIHQGDIYDVALGSNKDCLFILTANELLQYGL